MYFGTFVSICVMYRFIAKQHFNFVRQQKNISKNQKRHYQCGKDGVYGYRPKNIEPFQGKPKNRLISLIVLFNLVQLKFF